MTRFDKIGERLGAVGFLCALSVVLIHCQSMRMWFSGDEVDFGINGIIDGNFDAAIRFFLSYTFVRIAVPFFFVVSGFFLARSEKCWTENVRKRLLTLYLPFVFWNAVNLVLNMIAGRLPDAEFNVVMQKIFGWNPVVRLGCMQFWYIQAVFVFLLLWPVTKMFFKRKLLMVLLVLALFAGWLDLYKYYSGQALQAGNYLWMCCGAIYATNNWSCVSIDFLRRLLTRIIITLIFVASIALKVTMGVLKDEFWFEVADRILILSGLATIFLNLHVFDRVALRCKSLVGLSFFVFAFHTIAITLAIQIGNRIGIHGLPLYLFKICFAVVFTICIGLAARKFFPRLFSLVTGGRC